MVVKAGVTQKEVVRRAVEILDPSAANIIGVTMNNMTHSLPYYYDYGYYHYEYGAPDKKRKERRKEPPHLRKNQTANKNQVPGIPSKQK